MNIALNIELYIALYVETSISIKCLPQKSSNQLKLHNPLRYLDFLFAKQDNTSQIHLEFTKTYLFI